MARLRSVIVSGIWCAIFSIIASGAFSNEISAFVDITKKDAKSSSQSSSKKKDSAKKKKKEKQQEEIKQTKKQDQKKKEKKEEKKSAPTPAKQSKEKSKRENGKNGEKPKVESEKQAQPGEKEKELPPGTFEATGVIADPVEPKAVVNNTIVKVGDEVNGGTVTKIEGDSVTILYQGKETVIKVSQ